MEKNNTLLLLIFFDLRLSIMTDIAVCEPSNVNCGKNCKYFGERY